MLDSPNHMPLKVLLNCVLGMQSSIFCHIYHMGLDMTMSVFRVSDQVIPKPACLVTETS